MKKPKDQILSSCIKNKLSLKTLFAGGTKNFLATANLELILYFKKSKTSKIMMTLRIMAYLKLLCNLSYLSGSLEARFYGDKNLGN